MSETMLYRAGGSHILDSISYPTTGFDYVIVNDDDVKSKLSDGWHLTVQAAHAATQVSAKK